MSLKNSYFLKQNVTPGSGRGQKSGKKCHLLFEWPQQYKYQNQGVNFTNPFTQKVPLLHFYANPLCTIRLQAKKQRKSNGAKAVHKLM